MLLPDRRRRPCSHSLSHPLTGFWRIIILSIKSRSRSKRQEGRILGRQACKARTRGRGGARGGRRRASRGRRIRILSVFILNVCQKTQGQQEGSFPRPSASRASSSAPSEPQRKGNKGERWAGTFLLCAQKSCSWRAIFTLVHSWTCLRDLRDNHRQARSKTKTTATLA